MQTIIDQIWPLFQVILVDLVLAGDNAIVVALAAAGVRAASRQGVIVIGIAVISQPLTLPTLYHV